ncbi:MAG: ABC transporter ATP-binding protein, partial [Clostridiaceae bacterium]|nr:ABC transporter ATP-binding protein [Clostridiaceae bacterium]
MSVTVKFEHVKKKYGEKTVIPDLSLQLKEGEFFTLLGPSGCGKTTLLRMVAGFNTIEGGKIFFSGKLVNDIPANKRNIGMVFQNYAIFPHMTAAENVSFGLKNRKIPKNEIEKQVDEILKTVQIYDLKDTLPQNMSGGQ